MSTKTKYIYSRNGQEIGTSWTPLKWGPAKGNNHWYMKSGAGGYASGYTGYCSVSIGSFTYYTSKSSAESEVGGQRAVTYMASSEADARVGYPITVETKQVETFTLTFVAGEGGRVTNTGGEYIKGTKVSSTANPDRNRDFIKWEGADRVSGRTAYLTADGNKTATALFDASGYTVSVTSTEHGKAFVRYGGGEYPSAYVRRGDSCVIVAKASAGETFETWGDGIRDAERTISPDSDKSYRAIFSQGSVGVENLFPDKCDAYVNDVGVSRKYLPEESGFALYCTVKDPVKESFAGWYDNRDFLGRPVSERNPFPSVFTGADKTYFPKIEDRGYRLVVDGGKFGRAKMSMDGKDTGGFVIPVEGKTISLTATACDGTWAGDDKFPEYLPGRFLGWFTGGDEPVSTDTEYTFVVPENYKHTTFTAKFEEAVACSISVGLKFSGTVPPGGQDPAIAAGNSVFIASGISVESEPGKYYSGHLKIQAVEQPGWEVVGWLDGDVEIPGQTGKVLDYVLEKDGSAVIAVFSRATVSVTVDTDSASEDKGTTSVEKKVEGVYEPVAGPVEYGSICRFTFVPKDIKSVIAGLVMNDVDVMNLVQDGKSFEFEAKSTTVLHFKAGSVVSVGAKKVAPDGTQEDLPPGTAKVGLKDGDYAASGAILVPYGDRFFVRAEPVDALYFDSWCDSVAHPGLDVPIVGAASSASIVMTSVAPTITAKYTTVRKDYYVKVTNGDNRYGEISIVPGKGEEAVEITESEFVEGLNASDLGGGPATIGPPSTGYGADRYYRVKQNSSVYVSVILLDPEKYPFSEFVSRRYETKTTLAEEVRVSSGTSFVYPVSSHQVIEAKYSPTTPQQIQIRPYSSDAVGGTFGISPHGGDTVSGPYLFSSVYQPGSVIRLMASPSNGYRFLGWYASNSEGALPVSTSAVYEYVVATKEVFYARFGKDSNAIFVWEGTTENKTMDWRSRMFVSAQPTNLTSGSVYADGYPVKLSVHHASSPNPKDDAWRTGEITVEDQDPRRLPMLRPEKYVEVEIVSRHPVLKLNVSTSMGGMIGGI